MVVVNMQLLSLLIFLPLICGAVAWFTENKWRGSGNWVSLFSLTGLLLLSLYLGSLGDSSLSWHWFARF